MAVTHWMDEAPLVSYKEEKDALEKIEAWGQSARWKPADSKGLEFDSRQGADLVLRSGDRLLRIAVQPKGRSSEGLIRIQAVPTFREAFLQRGNDWTLELGGVPLDRSWNQDMFLWLVDRLFAE